MESSRLESLPVEVLHRIASSLPCSSIFNLCFSSRGLYAACYDNIVFKHNAVQAIHEVRYTHLPDLEGCRPGSDCTFCWWCPYDAFDEKSLSSGTTTEVDSEDEWYEEPEERLEEDEEWDFSNWGPSIIERRIMPHEEWLLNWPQARVFNELSASDSACIAHAVEKAQTRFNVIQTALPRDLSQLWTDERWIDWVPHLLALGHRSCYELKPWAIQTLLFEPNFEMEAGEIIERNSSPGIYITVGFCMVLLTLVCMEARPLGSSDEIRLQFCLPNAGDYSISDHIEYYIEDCQKIAEFDLDHRYSIIWRLILSIITCQRPDHTPLPSVHRLPLASALGSPIPFRTSANVFVRSCLSSSQLATYFSGDWTGWSYDHGHYQGHPIPPPMEDLHFTVKSPHPPYAADVIALVSSSIGRDGWGPFTLEGTVSVNGEVWLSKLYAEHLRGNPWAREGGLWTYRGVVTPFGISGVFLTVKGPHPTFQGYFWIWKKEWSHDWPSS